MKKSLCALMISAFILASCQTQTDPLTGRQQVNNTAGGAALGAVAGAVTGLLVAKNKNGKDQRKAALIGAGVGALLGGSIGNYQDRQEQELRQELQSSGVSVARQGDQIILIMPGNITFASGDASINPGFYNVLDSVGIVLRKYDQTLVDIDGHTDSTGSFELNQRLSEDRALSVADYMTRRGVNSQRIRVVGFGPDQPIASNSSEQGRQQNRRVEIKINPLQ